MAETLSTFDVGAFLLLLAAGIGLANDRWIGLPRNIALLLGAILVAAVVMLADLVRPDGPVVDLWRERLTRAHLSSVLLDGVLALLLFASTLHINPRDLRDRAWSVLTLATLGVVVSTAFFGIGLHWIAGALGQPIPLIWCLVLGAVLAPTDAVVVEGLLRRARLPAALRGMISGESLFNDGAAVVLFLATLAFAAGDPDVVGHGRLALAITWEALGGAALGWLAGLLAVALSRGVGDRSLELTLSLALALGSYRLAVAGGMSGPIAVVAAGLAWGHGKRRRDAQAEQALAPWGVIDDVLNTWLFLLMGFHILVLRPAHDGWILLPAALVLALAARLVSVTPPVLATRLAAPDKARGVAVLTWTGMRGGISIALAMTLPETPWRETLLALAYAVVTLSIVAQGLTVPALLRRLYPPPGSRDRHTSNG